jgi:hypothetical protein
MLHNQRPNYRRMFNKIFEVRKDAAARLDAEMNTDADRDDDEPLNDNDGSSPTGAPTRHLSELADALVLSVKGAITKADAMNWLLFSTAGRTMAHRLASRHKRAPQQQKDKTMQKSHFELSDDAIRQFGLTAFSKSVEAGMHVGDTEFVALVTKAAEREGRTFSQVYGEQSERGIAIRKADQARRNALWAKAGRQQLMPTEPTYSDETASAVNDGGDAYKELLAMAERMHAAAPERSVAAHFAAIYQDPKFRDKAARERAQARSRLPITGGFVR